MTAWLAPDVRAVRVEADLVFLDIAADTYLCLVGAGQHLRLETDGAVSCEIAEIAEDLIEAGLLTRDPGRSPPAVRRGLDDGEGMALTAAPVLAAVGANRRAARAIARQPFAKVLGMAGPLDARAFAPPPPALLAESRRFARLAPWLPHAGLCLMRSLQQRLYLAGRGHAAAWVFGVRTWPFEAHCWLQAGDVVLDDKPERVRMFTPILVV
jgi:hypothetical protein